MTLSFGNHSYNIKRFNFSINRKDNALVQQIDCAFSGVVDIEAVSTAILEDFEGSFEVVNGSTSYVFSNYSFDGLDMYGGDGEEITTTIRFQK
jgi:hypothetical protein